MIYTNYNYENKHGTEDFPFIICINCSSNTDIGTSQFMYCHWHNDLEIMYIDYGEATIEINTVAYNVSKGDIIIVNSGEMHRGYSLLGTKCRIYAIVFNPNMLCFKQSDSCQKKYISPIINGETLFPSIIKNQSPFEKEITNMISLYNNKPIGFELSIKLCLLNIILYFTQNNNLIKKSSHPSYVANNKVERLKKILNFIESNYTKKIKINEVASYIGVSCDHFYKFFKFMTGTTPTDYINSFRINKACTLLNETDLAVIDIALCCGFESESYFIKIFKSIKSVTPNVYRKKE